MARKTLEERYWKFVDKNGPTQPHMSSSCWLWTGSINKTNGNYGNFGVDGTIINSHRMAYQLTYGIIPNNKNEIMHLCDVPHCCNPTHLKAGTHAENMKDAAEKGRMSKHRKDRRAQPRSNKTKKRISSSSAKKLTDAEVLSIRSDTRTQQEIAITYNVSQAQISNIKNRKLRKYVK